MAFISAFEPMNPNNTNFTNFTNFTIDQLITNIPQSGMLYTLPVFDRIFESVPSENITRQTTSQVNNLIGIDLDGISDLMTDNESEDLYQSPFLIVPNCHVIGMLPFSQRFSTDTNPTTTEHASSIALALQHLNTGNSSIVRSLGGLRESMCSELTFTLEFIDTKDDPGVTIDEVFNVTGRTIENSGYRTPCSFVGAARSAVTIPAALVTGHKGYMELSGSSTGFQLDDHVQYPNFGRTIPPDTENVIPIMNYFVDVLKLDHLAVISMNEAYGNSFVESLQLAKDQTTGAPIIRRITIDSSGDGITEALEELKRSQYRYILAVMPNMVQYDILLESAYSMGLAGNGIQQWYFSDSFEHRVTTSETLQLAYNRTGVFKASAGRHKYYNTFVHQLDSLSRNTEDMKFVHSVTPQSIDSREKLSVFFNSFENNNNNSGNGNNIAINTNTTYDSSQKLNNHDSAAFTYDATIAMGISACLAIGTYDGTHFTGHTQYDELLERTRFFGATGNVIFNNKTGSRTMNSTNYKLFNYVDEELINEKTGKKIVRFVMNTASIYQEGVWFDGENVTDKAFIYTDGNYTQPKDLPPPSGDPNYPPDSLRGLALFFCAFSIVTAFGFGLWTWFKRSTRVIQASQPFFLYLVCTGVIMVAASIIPYSINDKNRNLETEDCSWACTAVLWLLFPGISIVFSALFTKTYRINLIMKNSKKFRRIKVTIRQTLTTMAVMLILNIITLSVMTAKNPPIYVRDTKTTDSFGRPEDTYGYCAYGQMRYLIALGIINVLILLLSAYQSWEARKLSTEFAESQYIFAALIITLTLFMVAIPVIIMSSSSPKTILFVYSSAILIFCMNILLLLFVPKIRFHYEKKDDGKKSTLVFISTRDDQKSSENIGEKILTTQSASNLVKQVHELQTLLRKKEQQEITHLPDCICTCKDAADPVVSTS